NAGQQMYHMPGQPQPYMYGQYGNMGPYQSYYPMMPYYQYPQQPAHEPVPPPPPAGYSQVGPSNQYGSVPPPPPPPAPVPSVAPSYTNNKNNLPSNANSISATPTQATPQVVDVANKDNVQKP